MRKKIFGIIILAGLSGLGWQLIGSGREDLIRPAAGLAGIAIVDDGFEYAAVLASANKVADFLAGQGIRLNAGDIIWPSPESELVPGSRIIISRSKKLNLEDGLDRREITTQGSTVAEALWENRIDLKTEDILEPGRPELIRDGDTVKITRVEIKSESKLEPIPFKTVTEEDGKLGWREKKTKQKGEKGQQEKIFRVVYHNNKEISRKLSETKVLSEPKSEIIVQGTYVKTGKSHSGRASWYAFTGTMSAANPWLPIGSFVRVTNQANGKSVIVRINDRGPFVPGRIIDLDKVAFQKIASLGAGVIEIKMEEIIN